MPEAPESGGGVSGGSPRRPTMTAEQGVVQATGVANYVFTSPPPWKTLPLALASSFLLGVLVLPANEPASWAVASLGLFFLPALLGAALALPLTRMLGGKIYLRRSALLAFLSLIILLPVLALWRWVMEPRFGTRLSDILIFSWGLVLWLWHLVLLTTAVTHHGRALATAVVMPLCGVIAVAILLPPFGTRELFLALGFSSVFLLSAAGFKRIAESPLRRSFGASGMELVRNMLAHWTEGGSAGKEEMERFFSTFSVPFRAEVDAVAFRARGRLRALWLVPSVHPGPFGRLGGSDLPSRLRKKLEAGVAGVEPDTTVMVFHGPATHDQNPASEEDVSELARAASRALESLEFQRGAGAFKRLRGERVSVCTQLLGGALVVIHTSAPDPTDDVDHAVGVMVKKELAAKGWPRAIFIDAHNCLERGSGAVHSGTREAEELMKLVGEAITSVQEPTRLERGDAPAPSPSTTGGGAPEKLASPAGLRAGFASSVGFVPERDGIGSQGIQVAVLESAGRKSAYVLFDGNNMVRGLREKLLEGVRGMVDEAEVFTTDNHAVHATMGGYNPVGARFHHDRLVEIARGTLERALATMEEVEVGAGSAEAEIRVFGPGNTARLTTAINSTVAILRVSVALCLIGAFLGCFAWHWLVEFLL